MGADKQKSRAGVSLGDDADTRSAPMSASRRGCSSGDAAISAAPANAFPGSDHAGPARANDRLGDVRACSGARRRDAHGRSDPSDPGADAGESADDAQCGSRSRRARSQMRGSIRAGHAEEGAAQRSALESATAIAAVRPISGLSVRFVPHRRRGQRRRPRPRRTTPQQQRRHPRAHADSLDSVSDPRPLPGRRINRCVQRPRPPQEMRADQP